MTTRNSYLDLVKTVLIYLVTLGHTVQMIGYKNDQWAFWYDPVFKFIYSFHMPLFIAISGYFTYISLYKRDTFSFIKNRASSILVPLLCWGIITFTIQSIVNQSFSKNIEWFWFIWALLIFSGVACVAKSLKIDNIYFWILSTIVLACLPLNRFLFNWINTLYPFFAIGYLVARFDLSQIIKFIQKTQIIIFIVSIIGIIHWDKPDYLYITPLSINYLQINIFRLVTATLCSISFLCIIYWIYKKLLKENVGTMVLNIGKETLALYLMQACFFHFYTLWVIPKYPDLKHNDIVSILISFVILLVLHYLIQLMNKSKFLKKYLLGNR